VQYATANGTATSSTAGNKRDYVPDSGYAYIDAGQQSATVTVQVVGDTRRESDETFFLNLSNAGNATIADAQGVGKILDDDGGRGKTWVGPASGGSWGTAANWSPSGVPVTDSLVMIPGAAVTLSASASVSEVSLGDGASLTIAAAGNHVLRTPGLYFAGDSRLNLNDNALIIDYTDATPMPFVQSALHDGYAGGAWNGNGIDSSTAASVSGKGIGFAEASELFSSFPASFLGQSVDNTSVLLRYTLLGDANLDGTVATLDFNSLAANFSKDSGGVWSQADSNYDAKINTIDFNLLAANFGRTVSAAAGQLPPAPASADAPLSSRQYLSWEQYVDQLDPAIATS